MSLHDPDYDPELDDSFDGCDLGSSFEIDSEWEDAKKIIRDNSESSHGGYNFRQLPHYKKRKLAKAKKSKAKPKKQTKAKPKVKSTSPAYAQPLMLSKFPAMSCSKRKKILQRNPVLVYVDRRRVKSLNFYGEVDLNVTPFCIDSIRPLFESILAPRNLVLDEFSVNFKFGQMKESIALVDNLAGLLNPAIPWGETDFSIVLEKKQGNFKKKPSANGPVDLKTKKRLKHLMQNQRLRNAKKILFESFKESTSKKINSKVNRKSIWLKGASLLVVAGLAPDRIEEKLLNDMSIKNMDDTVHKKQKKQYRGGYKNDHYSYNSNSNSKYINTSDLEAVTSDLEIVDTFGCKTTKYRKPQVKNVLEDNQKFQKDSGNEPTAVNAQVYDQRLNKIENEIGVIKKLLENLFEQSHLPHLPALIPVTSPVVKEIEKKFNSKDEMSDLDS